MLFFFFFLSLSLTHTQMHNFHFQFMDTFSHCLSHFPRFFYQLNPHSEDLFPILRNTRFHDQFYIWIVISHKSTTGQHRYNSFEFFICKNKLQQERYILLSPLNKTFTLSTPHNIQPHFPYKTGKFRSHQKILFTLSKITNNWLGEEGAMGCRPFKFIFKNVLFSINCTEQKNTKEIISLRRCQLLTES